MKKLTPSIILVLCAVGCLGLGLWFLQKTRTLSPVERETIKLFYYNPANDKDSAGNLLCSEKGLVSVGRVVEKSTIKDTLELLLRGSLTTQERAAGIETEFPLEGLTLKNAELIGDVLTLTFDDPQNKSNGGSCRVSILWAQIEETAKQFPGVREVRLGSEELFQP